MVPRWSLPAITNARRTPGSGSSTTCSSDGLPLAGDAARRRACRRRPGRRSAGCGRSCRRARCRAAPGSDRPRRPAATPVTRSMSACRSPTTRMTPGVVGRADHERRGAGRRRRAGSCRVAPGRRRTTRRRTRSRRWPAAGGAVTAGAVVAATVTESSTLRNLDLLMSGLHKEGVREPDNFRKRSGRNLSEHRARSTPVTRHPRATLARPSRHPRATLAPPSRDLAVRQGDLSELSDKSPCRTARSTQKGAISRAGDRPGRSGPAPPCPPPAPPRPSGGWPPAAPSARRWPGPAPSISARSLATRSSLNATGVDSGCSNAARL